MKTKFFIFLFSVLCFLTGNASDYLLSNAYYNDFYCTDDRKSQTMVEQVQFVSDTGLLILGDYGSYTDSTYAFLGDGIVYGAKTPNGMNSAVKNMLFSYVNTNFATQWKVYSIGGEFSSGRFITTRDGGAIVCAKFRKVDDSIQLRIVDDYSDTITIYNQNSTRSYSYIVFKVKGGRFVPNLCAIMSADTLYNDVKVNDAFTINDILEDDKGNLYFCGTNILPVAYSLAKSDGQGFEDPTFIDAKPIDATIASPSVSNIGGAFIFKCDANLNRDITYRPSVEGVAQTYYKMFYEDNHIYLLGKVSYAKVGDNTPTHLVFTKLTTNLDEVYSEKTNDFTKDAFNLYTFKTFSNDSMMYVVGGLSGIVECPDSTYNKTTVNRSGCILHVNKRTGKLSNVSFAPQETYNLNSGLVKYNNKYITFNYFTNNEVKMLIYDNSFRLDSEILLASGVPNVSDVYARGKQVIIALRSNQASVNLPLCETHYSRKTSSFYSLLLGMTLPQQSYVNDLEYVELYSDNSSLNNLAANVSDIRHINDKFLMVLGYYQTRGDSTKGYFGNTELSGVDPHAASNSSNLLFTQTNENLSMKWKVRSIDGECYQNDMHFVMTPDNGAIVCAKFRKVTGYKDSLLVPQFTIVDDFNDTISYITNTKIQNYVYVVFKVNSEGKLDTANYVVMVADTLYNGGTVSDAVVIKDMVIDAEGNIYLVGSNILPVAYLQKQVGGSFKNDTIGAKPIDSSIGANSSGISSASIFNNAGSFVVKCNASLEYIDYVRTEDKYKSEKYQLASYEDGYLYVVGVRQDTSGGVNKDYYTFTKFNVDNLSVQYFNSSNDIRNGASSMNYNLYDIVTFENDSLFYVVGAMKGVIVCPDTTIARTSQNNGFFLAFSKNTGRVEKAVFSPSEAFSNSMGLYKSDGKFYSFNYSSLTNMVNLLQYDADFNLDTTILFAQIWQLSAWDVLGSHIALGFYNQVSKPSSFVIPSISYTVKPEMKGNYGLICTYSLPADLLRALQQQNPDPVYPVRPVKPVDPTDGLFNVVKESMLPIHKIMLPDGTILIHKNNHFYDVHGKIVE